MDIRQLKAEARQTLRTGAHRGVTLRFILLSEIPVLFYLAYYFLDEYMRQIPGGFANQGQLAMLAAVTSMLYGICYIGSFIVGILQAGYQWCLLKLCRNQPCSISDLWTGLRRFGRFLVLLVLINLMTFLWSMLFIIPGIIAGYRYSMAVYLLLDHPDLRPMEAIRLSCELTNGYKMDLFRLDLSFWYYYLMLYLGVCVVYLDFVPQLSGSYPLLALYLISEVILLIAYLWRLSYVTAATAEAYRSLAGERLGSQS